MEVRLKSERNETVKGLIGQEEKKAQKPVSTCQPNVNEAGKRKETIGLFMT